MKVPQDRVSGKSHSPVLAPHTHVLQAVDRLHNAAVLNTVDCTSSRGASHRTGQ